LRHPVTQVLVAGGNDQHGPVAIGAAGAGIEEGEQRLLPERRQFAYFVQQQGAAYISRAQMRRPAIGASATALDLQYATQAVFRESAATQHHQ
jgi:hypothetical protein